MAIIIGIIVAVALIIFLFSIGMMVFAIAAFGFVTWVAFMLGGFVGAAIFGNSDARLAFYICGALSVVLLWIGIGHLNKRKN